MRRASQTRSVWTSCRGPNIQCRYVRHTLILARTPGGRNWLHKIEIVKFWGVIFFKEDHNILRNWLPKIDNLKILGCPIFLR